MGLQHLAVIMDGNGRWAKKHHLPRLAGHRAGAESLDRTMHWCKEAGISYLTVYAFSTENWKRSIFVSLFTCVGTRKHVYYMRYVRGRR